MKSLAMALGLLPLLLFSVAHAQGPDTASTAVAAAQLAARSWLSLVDAGRYAESWDSAAAAFRSAVTGPQWEEAVRKARGPLEPFGARKLLGAAFHSSLPNAPPGHYVILQYETEARGGQTVIETVTPMKDPDGAWRVSGYYVRPK